MTRSAFAPLMLLLLLMLSASAHADHKELQSLADEDQAARTGQEVARSDDERRHRVLALLGSGAIKTPRDRFNAALVLQHTGLTYCDGDLSSLSAENYLLAHHLFRSAFSSGIKEAGYLSAAAIDRYLTMTEGYQRYGTNRLIDPETGEERLAPIDRDVTDAERATYGVPSLAELLKRYPEAPRKTPDPK